MSLGDQVGFFSISARYFSKNREALLLGNTIVNLLKSEFVEIFWAISFKNGCTNYEL